MKKIPVASVQIGEKEKEFINDCLNTSWIGQGGYVKEFEEKFSAYSNCKHGITTTSGTTALHLACAILDIKEGDEVIISSSTNMACAFSVDYCNAKPVPADIITNTWQVNTNLIESLINKKTKAIMVVHLFGQAVEMDHVMDLAKKYKLKVIEDCAESHGVEYKGKKVGSIGDLGAFSFFSNKTITCGEGGMLVTNSDELAKKARDFKNLCYGNKNKFLHHEIGFNYRLPNVSAAMGLGQFFKIDEIIQTKDKIYSAYNERLKDIRGFKIVDVNPSTTKYIMWCYNAYLEKGVKLSREKFLGELKEFGIDTRESFKPINQQLPLQKKHGLKDDDCPNANFIGENGFYLPSGNDLNIKDIDYICDKVKEISKKF